MQETGELLQTAVSGPDPSIQGHPSVPQLSEGLPIGKAHHCMVIIMYQQTGGLVLLQTNGHPHFPAFCSIPGPARQPSSLALSWGKERRQVLMLEPNQKGCLPTRT